MIRQKWAPWIDPDAKVESVDVVDEAALTRRERFSTARNASRGIGRATRRTRQALTAGTLRRKFLYVAKDASGAERFSAEPFVWNGLAAGSYIHCRGHARQPAGLEAEPEYEANLRQVDPVRYPAAQGATGQIRRGRGSMFRREWCRVIDAETNGYRIRISRVTSRCWDKAATEPNTTNPDPDWTRRLRGALVPGRSLQQWRRAPAQTILIRISRAVGQARANGTRSSKPPRIRMARSSGSWTAGPRRRGRWRRCRGFHRCFAGSRSNRDRQREQGSSFRAGIIRGAPQNTGGSMVESSQFAAVE